jgi:hypothetical protein
MILDDERIKFFKKNGAVLIRKAIPEYWIEQLRNGVAYNMATPGKYTRNYTKENSPGFFWGDYCNWQRIPEYKSFFF